jgi:hypothetical protein
LFIFFMEFTEHLFIRGFENPFQNLGHLNLSFTIFFKFFDRTHFWKHSDFWRKNVKFFYSNSSCTCFCFFCCTFWNARLLPLQSSKTRK